MLPVNTQLSLYAEMLRIRRIEEAIASHYPEQEMRCPVHLSIGQEAVPVGVSFTLSRADNVMSTHRSHAHYLAKGGSLPRMLAEIYGKETGCSRGNGGSMHLIDRSVGFLGATPIVGSTIPIGVGAALGSKLSGDGKVTVVYLGDGAAEEGVFHESVNFAVLKQLPVIFVCENNFYSVYSHLRVRQSARRQLFEIAASHGLASEKADGNDIGQVIRLTQQAVNRARTAQAPSFLEFITYRWREHCGPNFDNNIGYRPEEEYTEWREKCPIARLENGLIRSGHLSDAFITELNDRLTAEINEAFFFAKESPFPSKDRLTSLLYAE